MTGSQSIFSDAFAADRVEEVVVYQHPLLFMKIWEIEYERYETSSFTPPWHYHHEVELLAVLEGSICVQTQDTTSELHSGDVMLLGSGQLHRTYMPQPGRLRYIVFQLDLKQHFDPSALPYWLFFSELTFPLSALNRLFAQEHVRRQTHEWIRNIYEESRQRRIGYELAVGGAIRQLLCLFLRADDQHHLPTSAPQEWERLRPVLEYIEQGLDDRLEVEQAAAMLNFSYHYFMRFFRAQMGMSFVEYVNYKRIRKAERLLLTSDISILEIACACGIPSIAQFYKLFKRIHRCSPGTYRNRMSIHSEMSYLQERQTNLID